MKLATTAKGKLRKFYTPEQVAQAWGIHKRTVMAMIDRGELSGVVPVANRIRIPEEEIERLLQQRKLGRPFRPDTDPRSHEAAADPSEPSKQPRPQPRSARRSKRARLYNLAPDTNVAVAPV